MPEQAARIVFAGSPGFAVPALECLAGSRHRVVGVLTQPDRPAGRGRRLQAGPVKLRALALGLQVLQPASLRHDTSAREALRRLAPDLLVVVAYGLLLPSAVLDIPRRGCINLHASILPRWRGAAPIQAALLAGDATTGVALMRLEEGLDTGPVLATRATDIGASETAGDLQERLARLGAELLMLHLEAILAGTATFVPQGAGATYAPRLTKAEARLEWARDAAALARQIRAFNPWPVAQTSLDGLQLRCWLAEPLPGSGSAATAGAVIDAGSAGIDVQTGAGVLRLKSVQLAGRQRLDAGVFANGYPLAGKVLGT